MVKQKIKMASKVVSKVLADKEKVERLENTPPSAFACNDSLWPGCLFDSHCHLNLVFKYEITQTALIRSATVTSM